ncbi:DHA2 family efflux MFS transporter permease subunit [Blastococcus sp. CT_GayMR20]|uniref:DHA2 family efflux MFS transporter permease subunit n=1 Tax=Blastococcus sp. CT_GayMR20 TaxID=2559609 RepID=UPI0010739030|nr:DHA2 family efflux MFS transporter permease subunit [Blastococcus sp. CT_GayMR20]TFV63613.1 DHA2 family efflux MFS transporter permease subunit [Blastococcus sp. CT_GayMR20]
MTATDRSSTPGTTDEHGPGYVRRWWVLATMTVCLLVVIMGNTILNVALPTLQRELGATQGELQWVVDAYILVFAGLLFSWGVIGDRIGRKRVLLIGLSIFAVGSVFAALSDSPIELIAWRAVMGVGGAAVQPTTLAVITNVFPPRERGRAIGVWAGTAGIAVAGGPLAGGVVLEHFWWGAVFLTGVPVAVLGIGAVLAFVPESRDPSPGRLDVPGVLLSIAALAGLVYGIIRGGSGAGWTTPGVLVPLLGGIVLLALFVWLQRRSTHPALDVSLFRNPAFSAAAGALGLNFFALLGATFYLVYYLQGVLGFTPLQSGAALIPVALGMAVMAPRSSGLAERFGAKAVCATGFGLIALSFLGVQLLDLSTPVWLLVLVLSVQGTGMGMVMAPATESIMSVVPREKAGAGAAVNNSVRQVGGALGVAILGSVLAASYSAQLGGAVDALPSGARAEASQSIVGTLEAVRQVQAGGNPEPARAAAGLVDPAREAFVSAMHLTAVFTAAAAVIAAAVVLTWLPGRPKRVSSVTQ